MDFLNRSAPSHQSSTRANPATTPVGSDSSDKGPRAGMRNGAPRWFQASFIILLFSVTVLAVAVAGLLYFGGPKEGNIVKSDKYQAVFLTNGQVYFGHLQEVNGSYLNLQNIFYLNSADGASSTQSNNSNAQQNLSLVKLGCEVHGPYDQMVINRDQVTFWENLKDDGQAAKAIAQWKQQNPNGQTCTTQNSSNSTQQSTSNTQNSSSSNSSSSNSSNSNR
ncbi:MAG TPA: hypothetical protein VFK47_10615 [Ktedonobacteraceae bacterium]|nr:hypothetical protein [Ktedonobacteraceae bacterium]